MKVLQTYGNFIKYTNNFPYVSGKYIPWHNPKDSLHIFIVEILVTLILFSFILAYMVNVILICMFPSFAILPGSLVGNMLPFICNLFVSYLFPCYVYGLGYAIALAGSVLIVFNGTIVVPFISGEFNVNRGQYQAREMLRQPPQLYKAWRISQVVILHINSAIGFIYLSMHLLVAKLIMFSMFMTISDFDRLSTFKITMYITWSILAGVVWCATLHIGGSLHSSTTRTITSWKTDRWSGISKEGRKYMKKFSKSCVPLALAYGRVFVTKKLTVLKFGKALMRGMFRALLTLGK